MYLHLGNGIVVDKNEIVAILDLDNSSYSHITREFLSRAENEKKVFNIGDDIPKSCIVCKNKGGQKLYLSQLSSQTLNKRANLITLE